MPYFRFNAFTTMIAEWISRRLGVVPITSMPLWVAYDQNLEVFSYIELGIVSNVFVG